MATATATRTTRRTQRKAPAKPNYAELKFEFNVVESVDDLLAECERYIDHVNERKPLASSKDKAQYWAGQGQAMKAFRNAILSSGLVEVEEEQSADESAN